MKLLISLVLFFTYINILSYFNDLPFMYIKEKDINTYRCDHYFINITPIICNSKHRMNLICNPIKIDDITHMVSPILNYDLYTDIIRNCENRRTYEINYNYSVLFCRLLSIVSNILMFYFVIKIYNIRKNKIENIEDVTDKLVYKTDMDDCIICLNEFEINNEIRKIKNCRHYFHSNCIYMWIIEYENKECPMCRTLLLN